MDKWQLLAIIVVALAIYFYLVVPAIVPFAQQDFIFAYPALTLAYIILTSVFVLNYDVIKDFRMIGAMFLLFVAYSLVTFPMGVNPEGGLGATSTLAMLGSDIYIYKMLPDFIPHAFKFAFTYIVTPALMILLAMEVAGSKKKFEKVAGNGA